MNKLLSAVSAAILLLAPFAAEAQTFDNLTGSDTWSNSRVTLAFTGSAISTSNMTLLWSAAPSGQAGQTDANGVVKKNICDVGLDKGYGSTSGAHTLYSSKARYQGTTYGGSSSNSILGGPDSAVNPFTCDGSGNLVATSLYSSSSRGTFNGVDVGAGWQGFNFTLNDGFKYQTDGYSVPNNGVYIEVTYRAPVPDLAKGVCPWASWPWATTGGTLDYNAGVTYYANRGYLEYDHTETCIAGPATSANAGDFRPDYQLTTLHFWPPQNPSLDYPNTHRYIQSSRGSMNYSFFDGTTHTNGVLLTKNWFVSYLDGKEIARAPRTGREMDDGLWTIKLSSTFYLDPSASESQSYTWPVTFSAIRVWNCAATNACPTN